MGDDNTAPRARFAFLRGAGRDGQRNGLILLAVFYLAWQILAVLYGIGAPNGPTPEYPFRAANYGFTVGIGLLVGATELIARYRDKPFEPLLSSAGLFYMLINAGASALAYYDGYRSARLPANLLQAQRDYFGAHTYERVDAPRGKFFHLDWPELGRPQLEV